MQIKKKADALTWLGEFDRFSAIDETGNKRYFVLEDRKRGGKWTIMSYPSGAWTAHGAGEGYCDEGETAMDEAEIANFLWENRGAVNQAVKEAVVS